jgi:phosphatidylethanolamine-binding protein (PEBP) family uncharacterized protein
MLLAMYRKGCKAMKKIPSLLIGLLVILTVTLSACVGASPTTTPQSSETPTAGGNQSITGQQTDVPPFGMNSQFILASQEVTGGGLLPKEYTCDGNSSTLPLEWSGEPATTKSFALVMYTIPSPNESHWYWVLYDIPPDVHNLDKNVVGIGILGNNSVNGRTEYAPPCSKGPGPKLYTYTIYALSATPQFTAPPAEVSRDILLAAIKEITLGTAELNVYYSREQ